MGTVFPQGTFSCKQMPFAASSALLSVYVFIDTRLWARSRSSSPGDKPAHVSGSYERSLFGHESPYHAHIYIRVGFILAYRLPYDLNLEGMSEKLVLFAGSAAIALLLYKFVSYRSSAVSGLET
jgi:hypothetical protein